MYKVKILLVCFVTFFGVFSVFALTYILGGDVYTYIEPNTIRNYDNVTDHITSGVLPEVIATLNNTVSKPNQILQNKLNAAKEINSDVIGWIFIPEFNIDYPVLYSSDNKKYLRADLNGNWDISGSIYMDASCSVYLPYRLIHGHNMKNNTMFSNLPQMLSWDSLDSAPHIIYYDDNGLKEFKIVSVFSVDSTKESVQYNKLSTLAELESLKDYYISRSWVSVSEIPNGVEMLLLNTCWYGKTGTEHNLHCIVVSILL